MKGFMDGDFLLDTPAAKKLYFDFAADMPICDYHCHLSPKEIYENAPPKDIAQLWLGGDHYKWRAMRSCGVDEEFCTGAAPGREKFRQFARTLQYAVGNPLYHWAHLELQKYFGISTPLNEATADEIYDCANDAIKKGGFTPRELIRKSNVKMLCTTDDPADSLEYHRLLSEQGCDFRVLPGFRPDKTLGIEKPDFPEYIETLGKAAGMQIKSFSDVVSALLLRAEHFNALGCRVSDHAFEYMPFVSADEDELGRIFDDALNGRPVSKRDADAYKTALMLRLGREYHRLGWAMEIHLGAMRNNNTRMFKKLGPDTGYDSVADDLTAHTLSRFLDELDKTGELPKTVLFNLNSKDNIVLATMLGNFQSSEAASKLQFGPAWWFLDTMDGMTEQLKTLGNLGILGKFIGMETDSRSFTSYARHDYFRRILCRLIGSWVENGMYANDEAVLEEIIKGICYDNAVEYFGFNESEEK